MEDESDIPTKNNECLLTDGLNMSLLILLHAVHLIMLLWIFEGLHFKQLYTKSIATYVISIQRSHNRRSHNV